MAKSKPIVVKLIIGLIFLALGGLAARIWWGDLLILAKGFIGPFFILLGIIILAIAKE